MAVHHQKAETEGPWIWGQSDLCNRLGLKSNRPPAKINKIKMTQGLCVKYAIPVYIILIFLSVNSVANYLFSPQNQNHFFRRMATNTPNGKEVKHVITIWKETFQAGMYRKVGLPRLLKLQGELWLFFETETCWRFSLSLWQDRLCCYVGDVPNGVKSNGRQPVSGRYSSYLGER